MDNSSNQNMYLNPNINIKYITHICFVFFELVIAGTSVLVLPLTLIDYSPAALGFFLFMAIGFGFLVRMRLKSIFYIEVAKYYSRIFEKKQTPLVDINLLPELNMDRGYSNLFPVKSKFNILQNIQGAIRKGYLKNCTIEIHDGVPKVALAKKVALDKCPGCGAPIVGVTSDTYICKYCGRSITNVLKKK